MVSNHVLFSPLFGEDFQFDSYFSDGLKPPTVLISGKKNSPSASEALARDLRTRSIVSKHVIILGCDSDFQVGSPLIFIYIF